MKAILAGFIVSLCLGLSQTSNAAVLDMPLLRNEVGHWGRDFVVKNRQFRGHWADKDEWEGTFCAGYWDYDTEVSGETHNIDFDLRENGDVYINADLRDVYFGAEGSYRSELSACLPLSGWTGVTAKYVRIAGVVELGQDPDLKDLDLRITSTRLGRLDMGDWVPGFLSEAIRDIANTALEQVWKSSVGGWINEQITELVKNKVPKP